MITDNVHSLNADIAEVMCLVMDLDDSSSEWSFAIGRVMFRALCDVRDGKVKVQA